MEKTDLKGTVERAAEKYAALLEKRIETTEILTGEDLKDIYEGAQILSHMAATLERLARTEQKQNLPGD